MDNHSSAHTYGVSVATAMSFSLEARPLTRTPSILSVEGQLIKAYELKCTAQSMYVMYAKLITYIRTYTSVAINPNVSKQTYTVPCIAPQLQPASHSQYFQGQGRQCSSGNQDL